MKIYFFANSDRPHVFCSPTVLAQVAAELFHRFVEEIGLLAERTVRRIKR